jgi:hypothetical protein
VNTSYTVIASASDLLLSGEGDGIYTSISGTAPHRIFNIEWRGCHNVDGECGDRVDFEVRLSEDSPQFELRYGPTSQDVAIVGVQKDATLYKEYLCDGSISGSVVFTLESCATASPTITPTATETYTPTSTPTSTSTDTPTATPTGTPTDTPTGTATSTDTITPTSTDTPNASPTANATPTACTLEFTDVLPDSTFYPYIHCLACLGIINGYTEGCESGNPCFRLGNPVTRGQIAKIVSNAAGFDDDPGPQAFEDVPPGSTFYDFIGRLASRDVMQGYPCGNPEPCMPGDLPYFRPGATATRGQLAKIVSNAANYQEPVTGQTFEDVPPGSTFYDFIERLASRGVMSGYPCGHPEPCMPGNRPYFRPADNVTRGQTSKIVSNTFFPACAPLGD